MLSSHFSISISWLFWLRVCKFVMGMFYIHDESAYMQKFFQWLCNFVTVKLNKDIIRYIKNLWLFLGITIGSLSLNSSSQYDLKKKRVYSGCCIRLTSRESWDFENDNTTLSPMSIFSNDGDLFLLYLRSLCVSTSKV